VWRLAANRCRSPVTGSCSRPVHGNRRFAAAYATHVLDVCNHYRFRAFQADGDALNRWDGQLHRSDTWQNRSSRRLARYLGRLD
jgi:hypothetical protein